jgi:hypothetical protein
VPERRRIDRYIARVTPPPLTSIAVAIDYANIALDPSVSLYERYNVVSTAVRLTPHSGLGTSLGQSLGSKLHTPL